MAKRRVIVKRIVSPEGRIIGESRSEVSVSGDGDSTVEQTVSVEVCTNVSYSSSISVSSSSFASSNDC
ncbi:MAG: hypothetical protein H0X31_16895 [Nostocaceae cyanobacterium]|nr:hypothetical protein [Nostocaceae cyanobacterium]